MPRSARGPSVLNQWTHGDLISVQVPGLTHAQFNSATQRNDRYFQYEFPGAQQADYDRHDGVIAYSWVARYTREFLDARLKGDAKAQKFIDATPALLMRTSRPPCCPRIAAKSAVTESSDVRSRT